MLSSTALSAGIYFRIVIAAHSMVAFNAFLGTMFLLAMSVHRVAQQFRTAFTALLTSNV
jgi:hypothetical protein